MTTTLADITLKVAKEVTDVVTGSATAGATTSLTDTVNLIQQNAYWDRGTLWILSGTNLGKVLAVTGNPPNKLNFATLAVAIAVGDRYGVARNVFPYREIRKAVNQALDEIKVIEEDSALLGDGETLEFVLPAGVSDIVRVELEDVQNETGRYQSTHWKERPTYLRFDYGFSPDAGEVIHIFYRKPHSELVNNTDTINSGVNIDWLKWKACEHLLYWGVQIYGEAKEHHIEELMNKVMARQKGIMGMMPEFIVHTAGS